MKIVSVHAAQRVRGGGGGHGGERGGRWCRSAKEKEQSSGAQGRLLTERAAWRSFRTSNQAATVTGKRGSIYYWEYCSYFYRVYSTEGRSCKVGAHLYFAFQVKKTKTPQNQHVSASRVKMGKKERKKCQFSATDVTTDAWRLWQL